MYERINWRTVDGVGKTAYSERVTVMQSGHLCFHDLETGRRRLLSRSTSWDVCETETLPPGVDDDAEVLEQ